MRKKTLQKLIIVAILALAVTLLLLYFIMSGGKQNLSKEELQEIQTKLVSSAFLNCVYDNPESIRLNYIFAAYPEQESSSAEDDVEFLYLSVLEEEEYRLENLYPEIMQSQTLTEREKMAAIREEIEDTAQLGNLFYDKYSYELAKEIVLENMYVTETEANQLLENLKVADNVLYSEDLNCFYFTQAGAEGIAGDKSLTCVSGTKQQGKYTVTYTLAFSDTLEDATEFEVSFYEENGNYQFVSNRCIRAEELLKKAEEFQQANQDARTVTGDDGTVYAYKSATSQDGRRYYVNGGKDSVYYKICYIKTETADYYFMDDAYVCFNTSEKTKYYYLNSYPRGIPSYEFEALAEKFSQAVKNTTL